MLKQEMPANDEGFESSPFGVADYVQLAGLSGRSVVLEIHGHVAGHGTIVIQSGSLWSARDERGAGLSAFRRLVFLSDAVVRCLPFDEREASEPRALHVSCESALLDAARLHDEARAPRRLLSSRPPVSANDLDRAWDELQSVRPPAASQVQACSSRPPPSEERFAELYEEGVDALLGKRFADAYRAFLAAEAERPGDSRVRANLERLTQMGYAP